MSLNQTSKETQSADLSETPPSVINQRSWEEVPNHVLPAPHDIQRFIERRQYQELGHELPLSTAEAAEYLGLSVHELEHLASQGAIPAYSYPHTDERMFLVCELDTWIRQNTQGGGGCPSK